MDGPKCPLYPTCSHYAHLAIRDYGFTGLFLFIDRLFFREFSDLKLFYVDVPSQYSKKLRYYDPLKDTFPVWEEHQPSLLKDEF